MGVEIYPLNLIGREAQKIKYKNLKEKNDE